MVFKFYVSKLTFHLLDISKAKKINLSENHLFFIFIFSSILNLKMYRAYEFYPILINTKLLCLIPPVCLEL